METKSESKYERLRKIGIGSYGVVFKCVNRQTGQVVAIKRYSENDSDPIIRRIAMREVRMLRQLRHPNLIHLIEVFRRKRRLHLVFDYCELTVLDVIEKYASNCPLNLIKKIIWQLVNGVSYCHAHNCIHRDIKPENILINQAGVVKLCDFGFARNINSAARPADPTPTPAARQLQLEREAQLLGLRSASQVARAEWGASEELVFTSGQQKENAVGGAGRQALTEYVATRWYRAPELLVGEVYYDTKIDIWAIGCVTAELMRGEPIWPGKTDLDQLCMIKNSLGQLTSSQTHTLLGQSLYDQASTERLLSQTNISEPIERRLPARVGQQGADFVLVCLRMDPARRPSSEELLQHVYIHSARMAQFVKGASHSLAGARQQTAAELQPATGGHRAANTASSTGPLQPTHRALVSPSMGLTGGGRAQTINQQPRTNSQALMLAANSLANARKRPVAGQTAGEQPIGGQPKAQLPSQGRALDSKVGHQTSGGGRQTQQQVASSSGHLKQIKRTRLTAGRPQEKSSPARSRPLETDEPSLLAGRTRSRPNAVAGLNQQEASSKAPRATRRSNGSQVNGYATSKRISQSNSNLFRLDERTDVVPNGHRSSYLKGSVANNNSNNNNNDCDEKISSTTVRPLQTAARASQSQFVGPASSSTSDPNTSNSSNNRSSASSSSPNSLVAGKSASISFLPPVARH